MGLRQEKIADQLRDVLAGCLNGGRMEDPRLDGVVVTHVKVSPDLQMGTVYFRGYGENHSSFMEDGLRSATPYFRKKLASALKLRRVPSLRFYYDESIGRASRIENLLSQL